MKNNNNTFSYKSNPIKNIKSFSWLKYKLKKYMIQYKFKIKKKEEFSIVLTMCVIVKIHKLSKNILGGL